ncbi:MAG: hypothetical protein ACRDG5_08055 [Anaerolineales bacterium]
MKPVPVLLAASLALLACAVLPSSLLSDQSTGEPPTAPPCVPNEQGSGCLPIAPDSERVDLAPPSFSNPTHIDNRLHPTGVVQSAVYLGRVEGLPFRSEVTLLPRTKTIFWNGQQVEVLESQYVADLDGRIHEVARDWYAQADDGSVWYFGEDVFNYKDGALVDTHGTWLAGRDGPAAMIMPAFHQAGDVYRPENIPGLVFKEVIVQSIGITVDGPSGPTPGAIIVRELHIDGSYQEKTFAPGYGEFSTGGDGDLEALALAVPTDSQTWPMPRELRAMSADAGRIFENVSLDDWGAAQITLADVDSAWQGLRAMDVPPLLLANQMDGALMLLHETLDGRQVQSALQADIHLSRAVLDLQLIFRPPTEIDLNRFELWVRQFGLDAAAGETSAVFGDAASLEWIRDRFVLTLTASEADQLDGLLEEMRSALEAGDLGAAAEAAARLGEVVRLMIGGG